MVVYVMNYNEGNFHGVAFTNIRVKKSERMRLAGRVACIRRWERHTKF
jgi:hypothetical protein